MIDIGRHIEYLILNHDCVVLPGIGALIAHGTPARIDSELGCIFPPSRSIGFNPAITHNDGLLVNSVARSCSISYEQANIAVGELMSDMQRQIRHQGEVALGHVGVLRSNSDGGSLIFESHSGINLSLRYVGLGAVGVSPVNLRKEPELIVQHSTGTYRHTRLHMLRLVAAVVLLFILGFTLSTPVVDNRVSHASMMPSIEPAVQVFTPVIHPDIDLMIATPLNADGEGEYIAGERAALSVSEVVESPAGYYLIVASLPNRSKALQHMASHPDPAMKILESESRCRIYIAAGNSFAEARKALDDPQIAARYPDAWVYKKRH